MPRKSPFACTALLAITFGARPAWSQTVSIDFEHFPGPDGLLGTPDDIPIVPNQGWSNASPGLTTQFAALGILFAPDPPFTNQNVVVRLSGLPNHTNLLGSFVNPIRAVFPTPVSRVAVEFGSSNGALFPNLLEALRADGSTIASLSVITGTAALNPAEPIYGFRASWPSGPAPQQCVIDNLSYTPIPVCYANCDLSTTSPILNVNDFTCFNNLFAAGDSRANCDASTASPILNVNDFTCFMNLFAAGCT